MTDAQRYYSQINYSIDLQRIIESLCSNDDVIKPETGATHHYEMAVKYREKFSRALRLLAAVEAGTHKVMPFEPTQGFPSMAQKGAAEMWEQCRDGLIGHDQATAVYKAMYKAAPDFFAEDGK